LFRLADGDACARQRGARARRTVRGRGAGGAIEALIIQALLTMMAATVFAIIVQRNLFSVVVLAGVYSFLMATVLVALDAVDVAMTEASVGAGISTVLLLGALYLCGGEEAKPLHRPWLPLAVAGAIGAVLVCGPLAVAPFPHPDAPV